MNDIAQAFYVKMRGRSVGPFTTERLRQMAQQGQLSRMNMISADGQQWQKAGDYPQLFEGANVVRSQPTKEDRQVEQADQFTSNSAPGQSQSGQQAKPEWHYAIGTDQKGPVTFGQIRGLIQSGSLTANDMVWKDGMSDWEAISGVPEFSASLPQRVVVTERVRDRREPADDLELDEELKDTRRIIRSTTPWVFFICIAMYVFTALMFFSFIAGVIVGSKLQSGAIIAQAVINLLFSGVILTGAIFLNHYSAAGSRFVSKKNVADLNVSMRWLGRFWLFTGIVLIFCLTITLIMVIYMIAIGADLSTYSPWVP